MKISFEKRDKNKLHSLFTGTEVGTFTSSVNLTQVARVKWPLLRLPGSKLSSVKSDA